MQVREHFVVSFLLQKMQKKHYKRLGNEARLPSCKFNDELFRIVNFEVSAFFSYPFTLSLS